MSFILHNTRNISYTKEIHTKEFSHTNLFLQNVYLIGVQAVKIHSGLYPHLDVFRFYIKSRSWPVRAPGRLDTKSLTCTISSPGRFFRHPTILRRFTRPPFVRAKTTMLAGPRHLRGYKNATWVRRRIKDLVGSKIHWLDIRVRWVELTCNFAIQPNNGHLDISDFAINLKGLNEPKTNISK